MYILFDINIFLCWFCITNIWWVFDMKQTEEKSVAREHVMDTAERLFARKGYNAVILRDIAEEIGIHHTTEQHQERAMW